MAKKHLPCPTLLRQLLTYEPETGKLFWLTRPVEMFPTNRSCLWWNRRYANKEALTATDLDGYKVGLILSATHRAHRVIWALRHGSWPEGEIDHVNGDRSDNRIVNLRDVSKSVNLRNAKMYSHNTSGQNGVSWYKTQGKWLASIRINGKRKHLGYFSSFDDAVAARKAAEVGHGFTARHGKAETSV